MTQPVNEPMAKDMDAVHADNAPTAQEIMNRHVQTVEPDISLETTYRYSAVVAGLETTDLNGTCAKNYEKGHLQVVQNPVQLAHEMSMLWGVGRRCRDRQGKYLGDVPRDHLAP